MINWGKSGLSYMIICRIFCATLKAEFSLLKKFLSFRNVVNMIMKMRSELLKWMINIKLHDIV